MGHASITPLSHLYRGAYATPMPTLVGNKLDI